MKTWISRHGILVGFVLGAMAALAVFTLRPGPALPAKPAQEDATKRRKPSSRLRPFRYGWKSKPKESGLAHGERPDARRCTNHPDDGNGGS